MTPTSSPAIEACCAQVQGVVTRVLGDRLCGLIVKGSALRSDFIAHYSDLDMQAFVSDDALVAPNTLGLADSLAIQAGLAGIDFPAHGVGALQLFFLSWSAGYPADWTKPWPGTYALLQGRLPDGFTHVDAHAYMHNAHGCMRLFPRWSLAITGRLPTCPDERLPELVREMGALVKPLLFVTATLQTGEPAAVWRGSIAQALAAVAPSAVPSGHYADFFEGVRRWPPTPEQARVLLRTAQAAIDGTWAWYEAQSWRAEELQGVRELAPW